jgi:hypothetical protein
MFKLSWAVLFHPCDQAAKTAALKDFFRRQRNWHGI